MEFGIVNLHDPNKHFTSFFKCSCTADSPYNKMEARMFETTRVEYRMSMGGSEVWLTNIFQLEIARD
jgi:hypothetical protein